MTTQLQTLRADQARRERKRVEHKAIADAYFTQTAPPLIAFDVPSIDRADAVAKVEADPATQTPATPESKKKEPVHERTKEVKQMSVFAALLKDAVVRSTVSDIVAKSPPRGKSAAELIE